MTADLNDQVVTELTHIPRGSLAQNLYRAIYQEARLNALGARPQVGPSPADAHAVALEAARTSDPSFTPTIL